MDENHTDPRNLFTCGMELSSRARLVYIYQKRLCQNERTMNISDVRILMCAALSDDKSLSM